MVLLLLMGSLPVSAQSTADLTADFKIDRTPAYGPAPLQLTLDASSSVGAQSYQWWFFPGGETQSPAGPKTEMVFNTPGIHDIVLIVKDYQGKTAMAHEIAVVIPSNGSSDGNNGSDNSGNGGATQPSPQNQNPIADFDFTASPDGFTVLLDGSKSTDPDNDPLTYQWKSDAKTATGKNTQIVFIKPGPHPITLTVDDGKGGRNTKTDNTVTIEAPNKPPLANFTSDVNGFKVKLNGSGSYDSDGDIVTYQWQASDGQTANGQTTELTFAVGSYTITLKVTDDKGATHSDIKTVKIEAPPPPAPEYNTTARTFPQVIAAGISPSQVDMSDDQFNIVALVRPGSSATGTVTFKDTVGPMARAMVPVGVLSNGDEFYETTLVLEIGTYPDGTTLKTAWGPKEGQFNIVATDESKIPSQTYPYLKIGTYPSIQENKRQSPIALSYDTTARPDPQVIMAGFSPAIIDNNKDTQFDVIAIVRPGVLPIGRVTMRLSGVFDYGMQPAGELGNGDQMYKHTYIFDPGAFG